MPAKDREPTVFVVSNRLPVTVRRTDEHYDVTPSSGGLVSAFQGLSQTIKFKWYGWPGLEVPQEDKGLVRDELSKTDSVPVFLKADVAEKHYTGFSSHLPISANPIHNLLTRSQTRFCGHCYIIKCMKFTSPNQIGKRTKKQTNSLLSHSSHT
jgi:hypothetical protein